MKPASPNLAAWPNLGPKSAAALKAAGIDSIETLRALGSVPAYARVRGVWPAASLNLLWALEGTLTGLRWQEVAREHRTSLLLALEQHMAHQNARPRKPVPRAGGRRAPDAAR